MSSNKQKVKAAVSSMNVDALCHAIAKIPCKGGVFNAREALGTFIQHSLACVVEGNRAMLEPVFLTHVDYRSLGFTPIDPAIELSAYKEIYIAINAYLKAVRDNDPFTDLLSTVHAHFVGSDANSLDQFFTPWNMAKACSAFMPDCQAVNTIADRVRLVDQCCGAGALLLAYVQKRVLSSKSPKDDQANGDDTLPDIWNAQAIGLRVQANDKDPLCAAMTALQLCASQAVHCVGLGSVEVEVGDTLTGQKRIALKSMSRFAVPGGVGAFGRKVGLNDLLALNAFISLPAVRGRASEKENVVVLSNPPFGKSDKQLWEFVVKAVSELPDEQVQSPCAA